MSLHVTFLTQDYPLHAGGPNVWLRRLVPALRERDIDARVVVLRTGPDANLMTSWCRDNGVLDAETVWPFRVEEQVAWLLGVLQRDPPDVFVPNFSVAGYVAARWLKMASISCVAVMHSDDEYYWNLLHEVVCQGCETSFEGVVAVSPYLARATEGVLKQRGVSADVRQIPYGVPSTNTISSSPEDVFRMVYVGRLVQEQKRIFDLARAFCRVASQVPSLEALIIGDGTDAESVREILSEQGESLSVRLIPGLANEELLALLSTCHAFVLLSDYEGLPISLLEAMSRGVVPVCTRIRSGIPELVIDGVTGLLVDDRGDAFDGAIKRLATDRTLWEKLSRGARARVAGSYTNEDCATRWASFLVELRNGRDRPSGVEVPTKIRVPRRYRSSSLGGWIRSGRVARAAARARSMMAALRHRG